MAMVGLVIAEVDQVPGAVPGQLRRTFPQETRSVILANLCAILVNSTPCEILGCHSSSLCLTLYMETHGSRIFMVMTVLGEVATTFPRSAWNIQIWLLATVTILATVTMIVKTAIVVTHHGEEIRKN
jgi:hypothetical protein